MNYDELRSLTTRGDAAAAQALLPQARARRDQATVLCCWQVLHSARHSAWKALEATLRALEGARPDPDGDASGIDTTQLLQSQVVAIALIDGCRRKFATLEPVAQSLLDLATCMIERDRAAHLVAEPRVGLELRRLLREVLANADDASALRNLEAARSLFAADA